LSIRENLEDAIHAPLHSALGLSPSALPHPNGHTYLKSQDLHLLRGGETQLRCNQAAKLLPPGSCSMWRSSALQQGHYFPTLS